ncbi:MAG: hypothetical protein COB51_01985 [Moraxellaceae bacterium]|nr:MAG: hypothetical protein COB51_01985 [Moraxellaceae bacterium]
MSEDFNQKLSQQLAQSAFWTQVGFQVESSSPGHVRIRLPYDKGNTTAATALHGGVIAATLDAAGCLAAWSADTDKELSGRTLSCDVSYIAGALGKDIFGEAEVLRRGKEIVFSQVRVVNDEGKVIASGNHIYQISAHEEAAPNSQDAIPSITSTPPPIGRTKGGLGSLAPLDDSIVATNIKRAAKGDGFIPYMNQINWKFLNAGYGYAEYLLPYKENSVGDYGGLASGALLSAVDHAGSLAAWMTHELGSRELFGSTVNTKLQIFAPAINRDVIVKAKAAGGSGSLINSEVVIETTDGEAVAGGSTIYRIITKKK